MLRSKRIFAVVLALALGVLSVAAFDASGLLSHGDDEAVVVNTAARRPKPRPTAGEHATALETRAPGNHEAGIPDQLMPADASLYIEVASFDAANRTLRDLVGRFDPTAAARMDGEKLLGKMLDEVGGDLDEVDRRRRLALAISLDTVQPRPTLLLPVHAPDQFQRSLRLPPGFAEPRLGARYVGLALGPDYPVSRVADPLLISFEPATVNMVLRVDPMREQVMAALTQARPADVQMSGTVELGYAAPYAFGQDMARKMLAATETFELALDLDEGSLELHMALGLPEGSSWSRPAPEDPPDLAAMAGFASPADDVVCVAGWDRAFIGDVLRPFVDEVPQVAQSETGEEAFDALGCVLAFVPSLGEELGVFASFDVGSAHLAIVCRPPDAQTLLGMAGMALAGVDRDALPVSVGPLQAVELEEGRAARLTVDLGAGREGELHAHARVRKMLALLFGDERVELQLTSRGGWCIATLGADPAWRDRLLEAADTEAPVTVNDALAALVARAGGASPALAYRFDALAIQQDLLVLMAEQMGLDPSAELERLEAAVGGDPLVVQGYAAVCAERWVSGTELDLDRLMALFEMGQ